MDNQRLEQRFERVKDVLGQLQEISWRYQNLGRLGEALASSLGEPTLKSTASEFYQSVRQLTDELSQLYAGYTEVEQLGLPQRLVIALKNAQITTVGHLLALTPAELLAIKGVGESGIRRIVRVLAQRGCIHEFGSQDPYTALLQLPQGQTLFESSLKRRR